MQPGQDEFDARNLFLGMNIHGHAATVICHLYGAVRVQRNLDLLTVPGECLVDAVVDDFVCEVVRPRRIGVHTWPAPHRLEAAQDLDVGRIVTFAHYSFAPSESRLLPGGILAHLSRRVLPKLWSRRRTFAHATRFIGLSHLLPRAVATRNDTLARAGYGERDKAGLYFGKCRPSGHKSEMFSVEVFEQRLADVLGDRPDLDLVHLVIDTGGQRRAGLQRLDLFRR